MFRNALIVCAAVLAMTFVAHCADDEFVTNPNPELDSDGDGWNGGAKGEDCDDSDPDIYPGAVERENCVDDNCDGRIDEGTPNEDLDNDGFCPSTGDIGDCEGNPQRHPGMPEDGGDGSQKPNGIDDNCNGVVDDGLPSSDLDGDGFTIEDGDCNDNDPYINPGAIEVAGLYCKVDADCPGGAAKGKCYGGFCRCLTSADCSSNEACSKDSDCSHAGEKCDGGKCVSTYTCLEAQQGLSDPNLKVCRDSTDNDCDKQTDELPTTCDALADLSQTDPYDYARAMELCDTDRTCGTESTCPGQLKCVGGKCRRVLSASFNAKSNAKQRAIMNAFAQNGPYKPKAGETFAVLSTGVASYDPSAAATCPQDGTEFTAVAADPDPGASDPDAYDYIELALEILVPTNAQSFDFDFHFLSTEYPEYVSSKFNDTFWVQLQSKKFTGNISFDKNKTPIRINNAFFSICDPFPAEPQTQNMCTKPAGALVGTGYAKDCKKGMNGNFTVPNGGSTDWLHTTAPVEPGEVIKLTFSIFDKGDHILDSAVLIDNFRWTLKPALEPRTGPD